MRDYNCPEFAAQILADVYCEISGLKNSEPFYMMYRRIQTDGVGQLSDERAADYKLADSRRNDFYDRIKFRSFEREVQARIDLYFEA